MSSEEAMTVLPREEKGKTVTGYCNDNPVGVEKTTSDGFRCSRRVVDDDDLMTEYVALRKDLHCKYCKKKFSNSQALGGHQNAHKRERALEKMEEIALASVAAASSSFFPPSTLSSPCYTTRPDVPPSATALLGVRSLSTIHKPFIRPWSSSGRGAGGGWWWLPTHSNNLNRRISSTLTGPNPEQPHLARKTPPPYYYSPGINSTYWDLEHQTQPETTATDFNHGGGGGGGRRLLMAALQPPFAGEGGGSHDDHSENDDKEKEEGEAPEIDLTLTL